MLKAALIALGVYIVIVANEVFLTIGRAFIFALGLDPLVMRLTRRGIGRGKAALLVFFSLFVIVSVLVIWAATPVWNEARKLGFATIAVVMAGGALLGVIGAILAVPVAASLKVVFRELTSARRERMESLGAEAGEARASA